MTIRCFISLPLVDPVKEKIGAVIDRLKKTGGDIKWVKEENLHLTLKFLGNVDAERIKSFSKRIAVVADNFYLFDYSIADIGAFPDLKRPRVIWVGTRKYDVILKIYKEIEAEMVHEGFEREKRPFSPHITIGRVRSLKGIDKLLPELVKYKSTVFGSQKAESIHLVRSILKPGGAEYEDIYTAPLRRNA